MLIKISLALWFYLIPSFAKELTLLVGEGSRIQVRLNEKYEWLRSDNSENQIPSTLDPFFKSELVAIERIISLTGQVHFRISNLHTMILRNAEINIEYTATEIAEYINETIQSLRRLITVQNRNTMMTLVLDFLTDQFEIIDGPLVTPLTDGFFAGYHASETEKYLRKKFWRHLSNRLAFIDPKIFKANNSKKFVLMLKQIYNPHGPFFDNLSKCQLLLTLKP